MAPSEIDFYKVLGIRRHATEDEIKKAFRKAAKDTHPDKNPGDPTAKEKFQDLQRAHDTLKDNQERTKYDQDNPYHGYPDSTFPQYSSSKSRSATAKRYTSTSQQQTQWGSSSSSTFSGRGFAHQTGSRTSGHKATYDDFAYRNPHSGYEYTGSYRSTPRPTASAYDESYNFYDPSYPDSPPKSYDRGSASSRTGARQSTATPTGGTKASSSSARSRPNSTSDLPKNDSAAPTPEFNLGAYIQERRAREAAAEAQTEQRKQREEEEARRARRAEMEEHAKAEKLRNEERLKREQERSRAEQEARQAQEDAKMRRQWNEANRQPSRNGYNQPEPTPPMNPYTLAEEDLERKVNEGLRAKTKSSASSTRQKSKNSPAKPRHQRSHEASDTNGYADSWNKSGNNSDNSGGFAYPFPKPEEGEQFMDRMRRREREKAAAEKQREASSDRWETARENSSRTHSRTKSDPRPPERRNSFTRPEAAAAASTPPSPGAGTEKESPRIASPRPRRNDPEFRFKFDSVPDGSIRKDSYHTPQAPNTPNGQESPFSKDPDFRFSDKPQVSPFNFTTAEELFPPKQAFARPQSQPVYPTQPQHAPAPRQTPQPHAQQQHQAQQQQNAQGFKNVLWDNLMKTTEIFSYRQEAPTTTLRSPKKKMSGSSISKGKARETTVNPDPINVPSHACTGAKCKQCSAGNTDPIKPESMERSKSQKGQKRHQTTVEDDVDAMDTAPDTGVPSPTVDVRPKPAGLGLGLSQSDDNTSAPPRSPLPGQLGGLDNLNKFMVPPFRSGLNLDELKDKLPFKSQASSKPPAFSPGQLPKVFKPDLRSLYEPQTPAEEPFVVPVPPRIPKTPRDVSLESYNTLFYFVEPYITKWNEYEKRYNDLHASLSSPGLAIDVLGGGAITNYIARVRNKDSTLEESFVKAREKHMQALDNWVRYREEVLNKRQA